MYEGSWKQNMIDGNGRFHWPDGRSYVGASAFNAQGGGRERASQSSVNYPALGFNFHRAAPPYFRSSKIGDHQFLDGSFIAVSKEITVTQGSSKKRCYRYLERRHIGKLLAIAEVQRQRLELLQVLQRRERKA